MRQVDYTDARGRRYRVMLPDGAPDSEAPAGVPIGPPDVVDDLGLPEPQATALHNALFRHEIWGYTEAAKRPQAVAAAVVSAFKIDAQRVTAALYAYLKT